MTHDHHRPRRKTQGGQEILEFGLVAIFYVPLLLGTFVTGMNLIKNIQARHVVRDLADIYIHGGDFSSYNYQLLAKRVATGLNLQFPTFGTGVTNVASNLGSSGDGVVWASLVMYVGNTTDPQCQAVAPATCTNHGQFVFLQRVVFGNSTLLTGHASFLGDPTGATISSAGSISNPVTDAHAQLETAPQAAMQALWQTTADGRAPLADGQVLYVVEGYFQTPSFSMGSYNSSGVYARYFF